VPAKTTKEFDQLVASLPGFKVFTRHPDTRAERDDPGSIFGAGSYGDVFREVSTRLATKAPAAGEKDTDAA
jgi:hypothetical protein